MCELVNIQQQFQNFLLRPSSVPDFFISTQSFSANKRLNIYLEAYQLRLVEALATNYWVLHDYLGKKKFSALGLAYLKKYPSCFRSIRWFGDQLAVFMASRKKYSKQPHLIEIAKLEWLLCDVFDAADVNALTIEDIIKIPVDQWPDLCFQFHPAVKRLNTHWNVVEIWQACSNDETFPSLQLYDPMSLWVFWRKNLAISSCQLTEVEAHALDKAMAGYSWQAICVDLTEWMSEKEAPNYAASLLKRWILEGLIMGINVGLSCVKI